MSLTAVEEINSKDHGLFVKLEKWAKKRFKALTKVSSLFKFPEGQLEYKIYYVNDDKHNKCPYVLSLHTAPGGYDQAAILVNQNLFNVIAVSRPGYLRTSLSLGIDPFTEAFYYYNFITELKIKRYSIVAFGASNPAAYYLALFDARVTSLVSISPGLDSDIPNPSPFPLAASSSVHVTNVSQLQTFTTNVVTSMKNIKPIVANRCVPTNIVSNYSGTIPVFTAPVGLIPQQNQASRFVPSNFQGFDNTFSGIQSSNSKNETSDSGSTITKTITINPNRLDSSSSSSSSSSSNCSDDGSTITKTITVNLNQNISNSSSSSSSSSSSNCSDHGSTITETITVPTQNDVTQSTITETFDLSKCSSKRTDKCSSDTTKTITLNQTGSNCQSTFNKTITGNFDSECIKVDVKVRDDTETNLPQTIVINPNIDNDITLTLDDPSCASGTLTQTLTLRNPIDGTFTYVPGDCSSNDYRYITLASGECGTDVHTFTGSIATATLGKSTYTSSEFSASADGPKVPPTLIELEEYALNYVSYQIYRHAKKGKINSTLRGVISADSDPIDPERMVFVLKDKDQIKFFSKLIASITPLIYRINGFVNDIVNNILFWNTFLSFPFNFITTATLIISSPEDNVGNYTQASQIKDLILNAELITVNRSGYVVWLGKEQGWINKMNKFISRYS